MEKFQQHVEQARNTEMLKNKRELGFLKYTKRKRTPLGLIFLLFGQTHETNGLRYPVFASPDFTLWDVS